MIVEFTLSESVDPVLVIDFKQKNMHLIGHFLQREAKLQVIKVQNPDFYYWVQ